MTNILDPSTAPERFATEVPKEEVDFYREFCDKNTAGSRKSGLLDPKDVNEAIADTTTSSLTIDGKRIPVFSSIDHAAGYDHQRCKDIAAHFGDTTGKSVRILSIPLSAATVLSEDTTPAPSQELLGPEYVFAEVNGSEEERALENLKRLARAVYPDGNVQVEELPLEENQETIDSYGEEGRYPDMRLYGVEVAPPEEADTTPKSFMEAREEYLAGQQLDEINGNVVYRGSDIAERPELLSQLWDIYKDRFSWLAGEIMPVSLEDGWEDFVHHLSLDSTTTITAFKEGTPRCFMYYMEDPSSTCFWLNGDFFRNMNLQERGDAYDLFFPGIVAKRESGGAYMARVVAKAGELITKTGQKGLITFESTNISSTYIPKAVTDLVNRTTTFNAGQPELLDVHRYHLYRITPH